MLKQLFVGHVTNEARSGTGFKPAVSGFNWGQLLGKIPDASEERQAELLRAATRLWNCGFRRCLHRAILGFQGSCSGLCVVVVPACPHLVLATELLPRGSFGVSLFLWFCFQFNLKEL